jgi:hypothetical protein
MKVQLQVTRPTLLEEWFAGPPLQRPTYAPTPNLTTIKMKWVLGFSRANDVLNSMVSDKVWSNDAALPEMGNKLRSLFPSSKAGGASWDLSSKSVPDLHALHVNHREVSTAGLLAGLDGLTAALGDFSIYVAPLGFDLGPELPGIEAKDTEMPDSGVTKFGKQLVTLYQVGFFVFDSFNFEGPQDLGHWDEISNKVRKTPFWNSRWVNNGNFRDWRTDNGNGGDFRVYSDVEKVDLNPPDNFYLWLSEGNR